MYLIVGLGNPEEEYANTRHNMGFDVVNLLANEYEIEMSRTKFNAIYGSGMIENEKVMFIKPQTYMNLSGQAVRDFVHFYKVEEAKIIVIYDDMDVDKGEIKIRKKGGAGSHNGMKSVVAELGIQDFARIRVGIGRPNHEEDKINYVIGQLTKEEADCLEQGKVEAKEAVEMILKKGIDFAMNQYN